MAKLTDSLTILKRHQKNVADIIDAKRAGEKIGRQKANEEIARSKEADDWLRNWRSERGINPNSGVIPNDPADAPEHLRMEIFNRRADASDMKIAKKKRNEQRAYEDFVRDSQNMPLDESFKDLRRGQDGEGFDLLHELLDLDEAKNRLKINPKVAMSPADVPLGDGMIKKTMTNVQNSNKQKYDLMYQEGFINRKQYEKQMKRTFGKDYEQYLVE